MRRILFLLVVLGCVFADAQSTNAHVLITDDSLGAGAVLHITPDDDPIAGEPSDIFIEIRSNVLNTTDYQFELFVKDEDGAARKIITNTSGYQGISANYIFPNQGVYALELIATPTSQNGMHLRTSFRHVQRVARGVLAQDPAPHPRYSWAEAGVILALSLMMVILIIMINRRRVILQFTRDESKRR